MNFKDIIQKEKIASRKKIAKLKLNKNGEDVLKAIAKEKKFLEYDFKSIDEFIKILHKTKHQKDEKCSKCEAILNKIAFDATIPQQAPEQKEQDILPRFGNLLEILENDVKLEKSEIEKKKLPSQNDLTRWALKDAVLSFYQGFNMPGNSVIIQSRLDSRLLPEFALDFDVIAGIWLQKLQELTERKDKFALILEEYDKAQQDFDNGMRGSAFEKQLDRYREDIIEKLVRS